MRRLSIAGRSDKRLVSGHRMTAWPMSRVGELNCKLTASKIGRGMVQMISRLPLALDVRGLNPGNFMWNLWRTKWHRSRVSSVVLRVSLCESFSPCPILIQ